MQVFINDKSFECAPARHSRSTGSQRHPDEHIAIAVDFNVIPVPTG